ncbi:MAG: hypothetical protein ABIG84_00680 [archaeon]
MTRMSFDANKPADWNGLALKMIPVLIFAILLLMYLFNANSDKVYKAYYHNLNQTNPYDDPNAGEPSPIVLPHHILFVVITIAIFVVIAFALYILSSIDDENQYHSETYSDF